MNPILDG